MTLLAILDFGSVYFGKKVFLGWPEANTLPYFLLSLNFLQMCVSDLH